MEWMPMHGLIHDDGWFCFSVFALLPTLLFRFSSLFFSAKTLAYLMHTYHTLCIFSKPPTYNKNKNKNNNAEEKGSKKQSTTEQIFAQEKGKGWK